MKDKIQKLTKLSREIGALDLSIKGNTKVGARLGAYIYSNFGEGFTKDYEFSKDSFGFYLTLEGNELKRALEEIEKLFKNRRGLRVEVSYYGELGIEIVELI